MRWLVDLSVFHAIKNSGFQIPAVQAFYMMGAVACSRFSRPKSISKSAKLLKSAIEKLNPKKHLSLSVAICDRKRANRIPLPKVVA